uniref:Cohesin loading complex subunit SCC4 homolog n=1 Tax=Glossina austeni TaxID=7395 RepID=A0A1A9VJA3_GLOAU
MEKERSENERNYKELVQKLELEKIMLKCNEEILESERGSNITLMVCYYLALGQVKTVKPSLKQLEMSIQTIMAPNWPTDEGIYFQFIFKFGILMKFSAAYMDKAQKYTDKALTQIEKLKAQDDKCILSVFKVILLEHIVMCRMVMGNRELAIREIAAAREIRCKKLFLRCL